MFIATGRALNPITQTNWESVGVKPDVSIPSDDALKEAITLAKPLIESTKLAKNKLIFKKLETLYDGLQKAQMLIEEGKFKQANIQLLLSIERATKELNYRNNDFKWIADEFKNKYKKPKLAELLLKLSSK